MVHLKRYQKLLCVWTGQSGSQSHRYWANGVVHTQEAQGTRGSSKRDAVIERHLLERGLTTVLHELTHLVEQHAPDFVVLTETKLRRKSRYRKKLTEALEDYVVHTGCKRDTPDMT